MVRHRTASISEYSTRYSEAIDSMEKTLLGEWRLQAKDNRQGSDGFAWKEVGQKLSQDEELLHRDLKFVYENRLKLGIAREQARKDLPLSTYTEAYWKIDLHNLLHFLKLRMDRQAQKEIREYANQIAEIVKIWCPVTWQAFEDYRLNGMTLSRMDIEMIGKIVREEDFAGYAEEIGWMKKGRPTREYKEFDEKCKRIGLF